MGGTPAVPAAIAARTTLHPHALSHKLGPWEGYGGWNKSGAALQLAPHPRARATRSPPHCRPPLLHQSTTRASAPGYEGLQTLSGVTVHECARQCSVQFADCVSFDFREAHP